MRYLFVEHHPIFGGPQNRAILLAPALAAHGWETVCVLPDDPGNAADRYREAGLEVVTMRLSRLRRSLADNLRLVSEFRQDLVRLRELIRRRGIDLVVVAGLESPHGVIAASLERVPVVWQINGTQTPKTFRRVMMALAARRADVVMTTGTTIAAEHPGFERVRERWVPFFSPVDVDRFAPDSEGRARAREELGLVGAGTVVGTIGNVNPQKGHVTFVDAAGRLLCDHPDTRFVILGAVGEAQADYARDLWRRAEAVGLSLGRNLLVIPAGSRVAELAPAFDLFWFTSTPRSEGVPTAVIEAMALGLPVVATEVGGVADIVQSGSNGILVPPLDADALAAATAPLVADDAARARLGSSAREFVLAHCTVGHCLAAHLQAFDIALSRPCRRHDWRLRQPLAPESRS